MYPVVKFYGKPEEMGSFGKMLLFCNWLLSHLLTTNMCVGSSPVGTVNVNRWANVYTGDIFKYMLSELSTQDFQKYNYTFEPS